MLANYHWQGNVRELENVISYVTALGGKTIDTVDFPLSIQNSRFKIQNSENEDKDKLLTNSQTLAAVEKNQILQTIKSVNGNRLEAAKLLGIDRRTLYSKLKKYGFAD